MTGGLMQLVAYGAQDIYLTGTPQITFFKSVYRRYTNFSMEAQDVPFIGQADFGSQLTATVIRNGDLIHQMYLVMDLPEIDLSILRNATSNLVSNSSDQITFRWVPFPGERVVESAELQIGGVKIDTLYGLWMHLWSQLTMTNGKYDGYRSLVGDTITHTQARSTSAGDVSYDTIASGTRTNVADRLPPLELFVPLDFWFHSNPGLALPLVALQYHEVRVKIQLANLNKMVVIENESSELINANIDVNTLRGSNKSSINPKLLVNYIYLDTQERQKFAQYSHEYLIETHQRVEETVGQGDVKMNLSNLNHPVKELIWVCRRTDAIAKNQWNNFTDTIFRYNNQNNINSATTHELTQQELLDLLNSSGDSPSTDIINNVLAGDFGNIINGNNPVISATIKMHGQDRMAAMSGRYYNLVQPYQHHTTAPVSGVNVYSFALNPEEHQPSGTANFSRFDNAELLMTLAPPKGSSSSSNSNVYQVTVYARNYNILRITSGMGGLAYAN